MAKKVTSGAYSIVIFPTGYFTRLKNYTKFEMKNKTRKISGDFDKNKDKLKFFDGDDYKIITSIIQNYDLGKAVEVEDIVQDIFIKYYLAIDESRLTDPQGHRRFLISITHNYCKDIREKEKLRKTSPVYSNTSKGKVLVEDSQTFTLNLDIILGHLPARLRSVFSLHWNGFKHKEIAMLLNIEESASRKRLQRSKDLLRLLLGNSQ